MAAHRWCSYLQLSTGQGGGQSAALDTKYMANRRGNEADKYRHLKTYNIAQALPDPSPPWLEIPQKPVKVALDGQNIYVCGDYRDNGSINGAMTSGRRTAQQVLKDLKITVGLA